MKTLLFTLLLSLNAKASDQAVTLCVENIEVYPYLTRAKEIDKQHPGFLVEIIQKAFKENNVKLKIVRRPWKRCLKDAKDGLVDATAAVIWTEERDKDYIFPKINKRLDKSSHLWKPKYMVWKKSQSNFLFENDRPVNIKYGVSAPVGYIVGKKLIEKSSPNTPRIDPLHGFKLIHNDRLDAYIVEQNSGRYIVKKLNLTGSITHLEKPFLVDHYYMVFSKRFYKENKNLVRSIWDSQKRIRNTVGEKKLNSYFKTPIIQNFL